MVKTRTAHFGRGLFEFLGELKANNNREWFNANRARYIAEVEEPMLQFIADFGNRRRETSVANPVEDDRAGAVEAGGHLLKEGGAADLRQVFDAARGAGKAVVRKQDHAADADAARAAGP